MITSPVLFLMLMLPVKFVKVAPLYSLTAAAKDGHPATELIESQHQHAAAQPQVSSRSLRTTPQRIPVRVGEIFGRRLEMETIFQKHNHQSLHRNAQL